MTNKQMAAHLLIAGFARVIKEREAAVKALVGEDSGAVVLSALAAFLSALLADSAKDQQAHSECCDGLAATLRQGWRERPDAAPSSQWRTR